MKYHVAIGGRALVVDVAGQGVTVDGESVQVHLQAVPGTPLYHLLLDGESWTVVAEPLAGSPEGPGGSGGPGRPAGWVLGAVGERRDVTVVDERTRQIQELTGRRPAAAQGGTVVAPMPGLVVRVAVSPGDQVAAGAGLVVVEAMKMENELRAPAAGTVREVHVAAGTAVEKGARLVTLELTGL